MKFTFTTHIERGNREIELDVEYDVSERVEAILYGDYPQPAEGGEVELLSIKHNGSPFALSVEEDNVIYDQACDRADDDLRQYHIDREDDWAEYQEGLREERQHERRPRAS